jgi:hypothetical protein
MRYVGPDLVLVLQVGPGPPPAPVPQAIALSQRGADGFLEVQAGATPDGNGPKTGECARAESIMQFERISLDRIREHEVQPSGSSSLPLVE